MPSITNLKWEQLEGYLNVKKWEILLEYQPTLNNLIIYLWNIKVNYDLDLTMITFIEAMDSDCN